MSFLLQTSSDPQVPNWSTAVESENKEVLIETARGINSDHDRAVELGHSVDYQQARVVEKGHENDVPCEHCWG